MKKEQLIEELKFSLNRDTDLKDECLEDVAKYFVEQIDIPLECIVDVSYCEDFDWRVESVQIEIYFDTNGGMYNIGRCYVFPEPKPIKLKYYVINALVNWSQWSGIEEFKSAYIKDNEIMLSFNTDTDVSLKGYLLSCKENLIRCMNDNCGMWDDNNVERWNEYSYYVLPILRVLDELEKRVKLYD